MWGIVTKKIGRVAVKEQGKSGNSLSAHSLAATGVFFLGRIVYFVAEKYAHDQLYHPYLLPALPKS
jgi:hypothetical protein